MQFIDARDVADWVIRMIECQKSGVYNVTGQPFTLSFGELLEAIKVATHSDAAFTWVGDEVLRQAPVEAWSELPLYLPESSPATAGFLSANVQGALAEGLCFRALERTIHDTLAWRATWPDPLNAGLSPEKEQQVLARQALRGKK